MSVSDTHSVPLLPLSEETAQGLGTLIRSIDEATIEQRPWNPYGSRPVTTGGHGQTVQGPFEIFWKGEMMFSQNNAVDRRDLLGWRVDPAEASEDREPADPLAFLTCQ